ncbi:MAG: DUF2089 domain-containing protein [Bacillus subtilis]|nr:DUF2089 domain-containing protein [Bacillus subtilis]
MERMNFRPNAIKTIREFAQDRAQYPVVSTCPVCHHDLHVVRLKCDHCDSALEGRFSLSKFNYLTSEQLYFIELFVKNRGNIKSVEKEMDLSYPTIKKMLDDVILGLGYKPEAAEEDAPKAKDREKDKPSEPEQPKLSKLDILEKINKAELSVDAALDMIKKLNL